MKLFHMFFTFLSYISFENSDLFSKYMWLCVLKEDLYSKFNKEKKWRKTFKTCKDFMELHMKIIE